MLRQMRGAFQQALRTRIFLSRQLACKRNEFATSAKSSQYEGIDLRSGREVTSSVSNTFVLVSGMHLREWFSSLTFQDPTEALLQGNGSQYLDDMLQNWRKQPDSVDSSWQAYFSGGANQRFPLSSYKPNHFPSVVTSNEEKGASFKLQARMTSLIGSYQQYGHLLANIDPLHLDQRTCRPPELELPYHGLNDADLDTRIKLSYESFTRGEEALTLRQVIERCRLMYCNTFGMEFTHVSDDRKRRWLAHQVHNRSPDETRIEKKRILRELVLASSFERFLSTKFPHDKRYGLDGAEGLVPTIATILDHAAERYNVKEVMVGSCHRGRMTMLPCVWKKSMQETFAEFKGGTACDLSIGLAGDVKYHLGQEGQRTTSRGKKLNISLLPNPSHLEVITAVASGKAYASQDRYGDRSQVPSLSLHGDAAIAGQGVVYETLGLSKLPAYDVGGTIRVVVNNQIGFTTEKESARSSWYCSDIGKYLDIPIIHVNGDDVETLCWAGKLAVEWRAQFKSDIIIDVVCYRKYGHNEIDQPSLTQPGMYRKIFALKSPLEQYISNLVDEGSFTTAELEEEQTRVWKEISEQYSSTQEFAESTSGGDDMRTSQATEVHCAAKLQDDQYAASIHSLEDLQRQLTTLPANFKAHKTVVRVLEARKTSFEDGYVDWSTAESLAFATLMQEGYNVRLTGQDVQRGTFSQRHGVLHDQETGQRWVPLQNLNNKKTYNVTHGCFLAANSPLGEYAALAFEYGHTLADPCTLKIWEAQFGDFANTAQVVIDNLIASGRTKWQQQSRLVLSLPHGFDGQGAEHSSARLERFLLLCSEDGSIWPQDRGQQLQACNMQVVYPTTPANYFHLLRRQMRSRIQRRKSYFQLEETETTYG